MEATNSTEATTNYSIPQTAAYLNIKAATVRSWIRKGMLEYVKLGRLIRIKKDVLDRFIEANTHKAWIGYEH
jgi:excisionase family DNA binding protein